MSLNKHRSATVQRYIQTHLKKIRISQRVYNWIIVALGFILFSAMGFAVYEFNFLSNKINAAYPTIKLMPMGRMHITMYSHRETGGNITATGYKLKPNVDSGKTCAISRDLWQKGIRQGDILYITKLNIWVVANDTMAINNPTHGRPQLKWVDIYESDKDKVDAFGLIVSEVYRLER